MASRYTLRFSKQGAWLEESFKGEWVKYSDHVAELLHLWITVWRERQATMRFVLTMGGDIVDCDLELVMTDLTDEQVANLIADGVWPEMPRKKDGDAVR